MVVCLSGLLGGPPVSSLEDALVKLNALCLFTVLFPCYFLLTIEDFVDRVGYFTYRYIQVIA
jgi:hypothetical protein